MKNTITTTLIAIFSILFITVLFTIAELNIIAKTEFTNQLQQSVIMSASYLISCKLIIQIAILYIVGNILYHKMKDVSYKRQSIRDAIHLLNKQAEEALNKRFDNVYKSTMSRSPISDIANKPEIKLDKVIDNKDFIDLRRNKVGDVLGKIDNKSNGILLSDLLLGVKKGMYTFKSKQITENKRWKEVKFNDIPNALEGYEVILCDGKNKYYVECR